MILRLKKLSESGYDVVHPVLYLEHSHDPRSENQHRSFVDTQTPIEERHAEPARFLGLHRRRELVRVAHCRVSGRIHLRAEFHLLNRIIEFYFGSWD